MAMDIKDIFKKVLVKHRQTPKLTADKVIKKMLPTNPSLDDLQIFHAELKHIKIDKLVDHPKQKDINFVKEVRRELYKQLHTPEHDKGVRADYIEAMTTNIVGGMTMCGMLGIVFGFPFGSEWLVFGTSIGIVLGAIIGYFKVKLDL